MQKFLKAIPIATFIASLVAAVITLLFPENRKILRENWQDHLAEARSAAHEAAMIKRAELEADLAAREQRLSSAE